MISDAEFETFATRGSDDVSENLNPSHRLHQPIRFVAATDSETINRFSPPPIPSAPHVLFFSPPSPPPPSTVPVLASSSVHTHDSNLWPDTLVEEGFASCESEEDVFGWNDDA